jgi:hypothetical protein
MEAPHLDAVAEMRDDDVPKRASGVAAFGVEIDVRMPASDAR